MREFDQALDDIFEVMGKTCQYAPQNGKRIFIKVIRYAAPEVVSFGQATGVSDTTTLEVRVNELANPQAGDSLDLDGVMYLVKGRPRYADDDRRLWSIECYPAGDGL